MRAIGATLLLILLAGCATPPPPQKIIPVNVVVTKPCIDAEPERPTYKFGKGEYPTEKEAVMILVEDFEKAERYGNEWEAAAAGCIIGAPR